jgi:AraC-like DNA-binding protein
VNRWLLAAAAQCRAIRLGDLQFVPAHLHVGRGTLGRGFRTGIHTHTDFQIEYVLFGSVRVLLESGEVGVLKPGDGIVLPPGVEHGLEVLTDAGLLGALIRAEGKHTAAFCGRSAAACREGGTRFGDADAAVWAKQMINAAACDEFGGWEAETVASLLRLWLRVGIRALVREASWEGNNGRRPSKAVRHDQQEALRERALSFIRANSHRAIRAEDVARDLAISTRHLNRLFRAAFSETATQSITRHRLTQARRLLTEDPRLQIKEAAAATGYERVSYFSYCFRRQFGYPPSQVSRTELAPRAERENHGTPELAS